MDPLFYLSIDKIRKTDHLSCLVNLWRMKREREKACKGYSIHMNFIQLTFFDLFETKYNSSVYN